MSEIYNKVLVIDDNEVDRYIAKRNITKFGFAREVVLMDSAMAAFNYLTGLENKPEDLPQLIFLDVRMPGTDGFGFLDMYDRLHDIIKKNCIVMLLSTSLSPTDHERAKRNSYVKRFLNKPLSMDELSRLQNL